MTAFWLVIVWSLVWSCFYCSLYFIISLSYSAIWGLFINDWTWMSEMFEKKFRIFHGVFGNTIKWRIKLEGWEFLAENIIVSISDRFRWLYSIDEKVCVFIIFLIFSERNSWDRWTLIIFVLVFCWWSYGFSLSID